MLSLSLILLTTTTSRALVLDEERNVEQFRRSPGIPLDLMDVQHSWHDDDEQSTGMKAFEVATNIIGFCGVDFPTIQPIAYVLNNRGNESLYEVVYARILLPEMVAREVGTNALLVVNRCADLYLGKSLAFEYPLHNQPHLYSPLNGQAYISIALDIAVHLADMDAWDRMMITFDTLSMRSSRVRRAIAYTQAPMVLQLTWERDVVMEQETLAALTANSSPHRHQRHHAPYLEHRATSECQKVAFRFVFSEYRQFQHVVHPQYVDANICVGTCTNPWLQSLNNGATNQQLFHLFLTGVRPVLRDELKRCNVVTYEGVDVTVQMDDGSWDVQTITNLSAKECVCQ